MRITNTHLRFAEHLPQHACFKALYRYINLGEKQKHANSMNPPNRGKDERVCKIKCTENKLKHKADV